jgi:hypothetical protein
MSQIFFSKQDPAETLNRLTSLGNSRGFVTIWLKGTKNKHDIRVIKYDKDRNEIVLDSQENLFPIGSTVLCTFELRGMNFFSEVIYQHSVSDFIVLQFKNTLFKSERRNSYRLMTYPQYDVWAEFDLGEAYEGGKVIDLKTKTNQTGLFKNFIKLVDGTQEEDGERIKIRVQDLSTTGLALHVSELEYSYFPKEIVYKKVLIRFSDSSITIPEAKVVYLVDYISSDKNIKKYKVGINFPNLPPTIDDQIGKKINELLRQNEFNKDFENFIK